MIPLWKQTEIDLISYITWTESLMSRIYYIIVDFFLLSKFIGLSASLVGAIDQSLNFRQLRLGY